jgi:hypothetical protein
MLAPLGCNRHENRGSGQLSIIEAGTIAWLKAFHLRESFQPIITSRVDHGKEILVDQSELSRDVQASLYLT